MNKNILNILKDLEKFDENWNNNIEKLESIIDHVHPDIMNLLENLDVDDVYQKVINYKPLILDPISDKDKLKELYNNCLNQNEEKYSCEEMLYFLTLAFGKKFNSDYLYYPNEIVKEKDEPFSFEEFYSIWKKQHGQNTL